MWKNKKIKMPNRVELFDESDIPCSSFFSSKLKLELETILAAARPKGV